MFCKNCEYYATEKQKGYCSICYKKEFNIILSLEERRKEESPEKIKLWVDHLIHDTIKGCCISCNNKTDLYNKFLCDCDPIFCMDCLKNEINCRVCKQLPYFRLSKDQLIALTMSNCNEKTIMKVIAKISQTNELSNSIITIDNLVATSEEISYAVNKVAKTQTVNYSHFNNIYSFALDLWNIPDKIANQPNTAHCYKSTFNEPPKTYQTFLRCRFGASTIKKSEYKIT